MLRTRTKGRERKRVTSGWYQVEEEDKKKNARKMEKDTVRGKRDTGTLVTSPSWSTQWDSRTLGWIAVGCRLTERKGVRISQLQQREVAVAAEDERTRDASQRENQRRRADTIGEPRARRVINNRALAPAPRVASRRVVPASLSLFVLADPFFPPLSAIAVSLSRFFCRSSSPSHEHRLRPRLQVAPKDAWSRPLAPDDWMLVPAKIDDGSRDHQEKGGASYIFAWSLFYLSASPQAFFRAMYLGMIAISQAI